MGREGDEVREPSAMHAAINDELQAAARRFGATRMEMQSLDAGHPKAAYDTLKSLGARSDLLEIVGSIGDSRPDEWVLSELQRWNTEET